MSTASIGAREFHRADARRYTTTGPVRWIMSHTRPYWILPLTLVGTSIINNWAYGNVPLFVGRGFDIISSEGWARRELLIVAVIIGASAIGQGLTGLLRNFAVELLAQRVERDSRDELYTSLLGKSQSYHAALRTGDMMARAANDVRALNMMFSPGIMLIVDSLLAILVPFAMILFIDPRLWLVPTVFLGLLAVTVWDYNKRLEPVTIAERETFGEMNSVLAESIGGVELVKANVRERYAWEKFTGRAAAYRDWFVKQGDIQARYWPMLAFAVCWGGALFHSLLLWRAGTLTLGEVVSFMGLFATFRFATFISIFSFNLVQIGIASAARILGLITAETKLDQNVAGRSAPIEGRIEFRGVSFSFDAPIEATSALGEAAADAHEARRHPKGEPAPNSSHDQTASPAADPPAAGPDRPATPPVLSDISFTVEPGETIAIVGRTGSGKTTLARLINRIFDATSGQVLIDGVDVREWNLESLRNQISVIEQDVFLFSMPIGENIAFGRRDANEDEIVEAARQAQADGFIRSFRDGYQTEVGERGVTLSGGQKQRIAIARAFLTDPRILILDDSTSAIDSRTEDEIQRAMRRIAHDRTTILITHRLSQIRHADRIILLGRGRVLDSGTHEELLARSEDYRRIFDVL